MIEGEQDQDPDCEHDRTAGARDCQQVGDGNTQRRGEEHPPSVSHLSQPLSPFSKHHNIPLEGERA